MSTFDGIVAEFPDIRIDYFRVKPNTRPPLAFFLSHVHSDHRVGLESFHGPFIYCTPATRDILLKLETYPHRMNFARGILETRKQTFRHLKKTNDRDLVKAIPLETPVVIELVPGREIQVTLFDANHCVGACMFLIEGQGKAVLYTGDIRSELWWVNSLVRNPLLLPYACQTGLPLKKLDCIYLDTTFVITGQEDPHRDFPSKAQGIRELLQKVAQYPSGTQFYLDSWTFGYEEVWQALSKFLGSQVHLDEYRYGVYGALASGVEPKAQETRPLVGGHSCGNHPQKGCLTEEQSRLHSCEQGTECGIWTKDFVRITPIVSRYQGKELAELGAGGGQSDLNQRHELELCPEEVVKLMSLVTAQLQDQPQLLADVVQLLVSVISNKIDVLELKDFLSATQTSTSRPLETAYLDLDEMPLEKLVPALAKLVTSRKLNRNQADGSHERSSVKPVMRPDGLPKHITFPYSRHSSYNELCLFLEAFKPRDIFPCTVDEKNWTPECSMNMLFGHIYKSPPKFRHDERMLKKPGVLKANTMVADSRPGSSGSTSTGYVTPNEGHSRIQDEIQGNGKGRKRSYNEQSGSDSDSRRPKRLSREAQLDTWPPRQVDHYSPPTGLMIDHYSTPLNQPPRSSIESEAASSSDKHIASASLSRLAKASKSRQRSPVSYRGQILIARSPSRGLGTTTEQAQQRKSLEYGRLSPELGHLSTNAEAKALIESDALTKPSRLQTLEYGRLSPTPTADGPATEYKEVSSHRLQSRTPSTPSLQGSASAKSKLQLSPRAKERLAFRQEAYNAVLEIDGRKWNDIGLVSVRESD